MIEHQKALKAFNSIKESETNSGRKNGAQSSFICNNEDIEDIGEEYNLIGRKGSDFNSIMKMKSTLSNLGNSDKQQFKPKKDTTNIRSVFTNISTNNNQENGKVSD